MFGGQWGQIITYIKVALHSDLRNEALTQVSVTHCYKICEAQGNQFLV
jgi:hypothetical protein